MTARMNTQPCGVAECDRLARTAGYCNRHYQRLLRHGTPDGGAPSPKRQRPSGLSLQEVLDFYSTLQPNGCVEWNGTLVNRYPVFMYEGQRHRAHRVSYELHYGVDPGPLLVCHRCDNPPCINPLHLFLGTHSDNMRDCAAKGRMSQPRARGLANGRAKLTDGELAAITAAYYSPAIGTQEIAQRFGIHRSTVRRVAKGLARR